jgi:hypothetical protein
MGHSATAPAPSLSPLLPLRLPPSPLSTVVPPRSAPPSTPVGSRSNAGHYSKGGRRVPVDHGPRCDCSSALSWATTVVCPDRPRCAAVWLRRYIQQGRRTVWPEIDEMAPCLHRQPPPNLDMPARTAFLCAPLRQHCQTFCSCSASCACSSWRVPKPSGGGAVVARVPRLVDAMQVWRLILSFLYMFL